MYACVQTASIHDHPHHAFRSPDRSAKWVPFVYRCHLSGSPEDQRWWRSHRRRRYGYSSRRTIMSARICAGCGQTRGVRLFRCRLSQASWRICDLAVLLRVYLRCTSYCYMSTLCPNAVDWATRRIVPQQPSREVVSNSSATR